MANSKVLVRIGELKSERNERLEINADYVLKRLIGIDEMDIADILNEQGVFRMMLFFFAKTKAKYEDYQIFLKAHLNSSF